MYINHSKNFNIHSWSKKRQTTKLGRERNFLTLKKIIYKKPAANIILSGEDCELLPKIGNKTRPSAFTTLLFNIVLEVLASAIMQEKEIKLPIFILDMVFLVTEKIPKNL